MPVLRVFECTGHDERGLPDLAEALDRRRIEGFPGLYVGDGEVPRSTQMRFIHAAWARAASLAALGTVVGQDSP